MTSERAATIRVYTLSGCGHCGRARELLRRRGIVFTEVRGDTRPRFRQELMKLTGRSTVPQVLVDGTAIGGASDLARLDRLGLLVPLVGRQRFPRAIVSRRFSPIGLASKIVGVGSGPWRHTVEIVTRDGSVLERRSAREAVARELATAFNAGDVTGFPTMWEHTHDHASSPRDVHVAQDHVPTRTALSPPSAPDDESRTNSTMSPP